MRIAVYLTALAAMLFIGSCSKSGMQSDSTSMVYTEPAEIQIVNDSVEALAGSLQGQAKYADYKAVYDYFIAKYPNSTLLQRDYQALFDGFQKQEDKIAYYKNMYESNPKSAMAAYLYGRTLGGMEALEYFQKAVDLDPDYFWGNFGAGSAYLSSNPPDTAKALACYAKAVEADKTYPTTYTQIAAIYMARLDYAKALENAKLFAATSPTQYRPVALQADILTKMGNEKDAEAIMTKFADAVKDNLQIRRSLVELYKKQGKYPEALAYQHAVVGLSKQPADELVDLAKIYAMSGQADSALAYLNMAADQGYADFRRLSRNEALTPVRELAGFGELITRLKTVAATQRNQRLAEVLADAEGNRMKAVSEVLNVPAPAFAFVNLDGQTISLESLRGKVVVVDFWATWCGPCRMTMPLLQEYVEAKPEGVEFISMNVWEEDTTKVRPYLSDYGYTFNVLFGNSQIASAYEVSGIPTLIVIDQDGIIRYRHIGYDPSTDQVLQWQTEELLHKGQQAQTL